MKPQECEKMKTRTCGLAQKYCCGAEYFSELMNKKCGEIKEQLMLYPFENAEEFAKAMTEMEMMCRYGKYYYRLYGAMEYLYDYYCYEPEELEVVVNDVRMKKIIDKEVTHIMVDIVAQNEILAYFTIWFQGTDKLTKEQYDEYQRLYQKYLDMYENSSIVRKYQTLRKKLKELEEEVKKLQNDNEYLKMQVEEREKKLEEWKEEYDKLADALVREKEKSEMLESLIMTEIWYPIRTPRQLLAVIGKAGLYYHDRENEVNQLIREKLRATDNTRVWLPIKTPKQLLAVLKKLGFLPSD